MNRLRFATTMNQTNPGQLSDRIIIQSGEKASRMQGISPVCSHTHSQLFLPFGLSHCHTSYSTQPNALARPPSTVQKSTTVFWKFSIGKLKFNLTGQTAVAKITPDSRYIRCDHKPYKKQTLVMFESPLNGNFSILYLIICLKCHIFKR